MIFGMWHQAEYSTGYVSGTRNVTSGPVWIGVIDVLKRTVLSDRRVVGDVATLSVGDGAVHRVVKPVGPDATIGRWSNGDPSTD